MPVIHDFPTVPVSKQVFHVPGQAVDGGWTSGAVHILSPEPGGRSVLEMQIALQVREWEYPESSWLMSMGNGEIFRVRLAPTPQVLSARTPGVLWNNDQPWSNLQPWAGDITAVYAADALEGTTTLVVDMTGYGDIVRRGHVVGHGNNCYKVMKTTYDSTTGHVTMSVTPPLRNNVVAGDQTFFRPYFLGTIGNIEQVRTTYDASNVGAIQIGSISFREAIL